MTKRRSNSVRKLKETKRWLSENEDVRNYIFYAVNLVINPLRAVAGIAGKVYESAAPKLYSGNSHVVNIARAGMAVLTVLDLMNYSGIADTFGDALLATALVTDTSYWRKKSLTGVGDDVKRLTAGAKDLSGRLK